MMGIAIGWKMGTDVGVFVRNLIVILEDLGSDGGGTEAQTASARTVGMIFQKIIDFYMKIT